MPNYFTRAQSNPQLGNLPNPYPEYQAPNIAGSLETLFNNYLAMKQDKRAGEAATGAEQVRRGTALMQNGVDPRAVGQAPQAMQNPEVVPGLQAFIDNKKKMQLMAEKAGQADIDKTLSETKENNAQADAYDRDQVYVDPDTGKQIVVPRGAKLIPRPPKGGKAATNQDLTSAMELYETAKEGLLSGLGGSETGQIMGRLPAFTANQQIAKGSVAAMAPVLKQIFRTAGEGVFTDRDQQLLLDMIPTRTELPEARKAMIANIDAIVKAKIKSGMRNASPAPDNAPKPKSDPLGIF